MSNHPTDIVQHREFWAQVVEAGGPRKYVESELRSQGVWVRREDVLGMGAKQKQAYIQRLQAEELIRKPLQNKVWTILQNAMCIICKLKCAPDSKT